MTDAQLAHDDDDLDDTHDSPARRRFARTMAHALVEALMMPRLCTLPRCRRSGTCKGDAHACQAVADTLLTREVIAGARLHIQGEIEGLRLDALFARAPDRMKAYALWLDCIAPLSPALKRQMGGS